MQNNKPKVIHLLGGPCSGKSTWLRKNYPNCCHYNNFLQYNDEETFVIDAYEIAGKNGLLCWDLWCVFSGNIKEVTAYGKTKIPWKVKTVILVSEVKVEHLITKTKNQEEVQAKLQELIDETILFKTIKNPNPSILGRLL